MNSIKTILLLLGLSIFSIPSFSQAGTLDSSFHKDGAVFFHFAGGSAVATAIAVLPNEKILVAGTVVTGPGADSDILLLRFNPDGLPDPTFGEGGIVIFDWNGQADFASAIAVQLDGGIVVAGGTKKHNSLKAFAMLIRFTADGELDNTFKEGGLLLTQMEISTGSQMKVILQDDGKLLWCMRPKGTRSWIGRFKSNGDADGDFGDVGVVTQSNGDSVIIGISAAWELLPNGRIGVLCTLVDDTAIWWRIYTSYSNDGKDPISSFNSNFNRDLYINTLSDNQSIYAVGAGQNFNGLSGILVNKFDFDDDFVLDFATSARRLNETGGKDEAAFALAAHVDGKLVIVGHDGFTPDKKIFIERLGADGLEDKSFGNNGQTLLNFSPKPDIAYTTAIDADDRILVAGQSGDSLVIVRVFGSKYNGPPSIGVDSIFFGFRPNPVENELTADYGLPTDGQISMELLDLFGRQVQTFYFNVNRQAGHYIEPLHILDEMPNGAYFLRFRSGKFHALQKLIVVR